VAARGLLVNEGAAARRLHPRWIDDARHVLVALREALARQLARPGLVEPGVRVVDLGAGDAPYRPLFTARGASYTCSDLDDAAEVRIVPGEPLPLAAGSADLVVSFQVLEHVWDVGWYLREARRLLRADGHLLLSTHGVWPYHPHPSDYRRWTRPGLVGEVEAAGFAVEHVEGLVGPLAWTTTVRLLGFNQVLRRLPAIGPLAGGLLAALMNLRMVCEDAITPAAIRRDHACVYLLLARAAR
jgi:SAM-dependent methyltransferase